jgi:hypothetical protein
MDEALWKRFFEAPITAWNMQGVKPSPQHAGAQGSVRRRQAPIRAFDARRGLLYRRFLKAECVSSRNIIVAAKRDGNHVPGLWGYSFKGYNTQTVEYKTNTVVDK